jgi:hypothetical protein
MDEAGNRRRHIEPESSQMQVDVLAVTEEKVRLAHLAGEESEAARDRSRFHATWRGCHGPSGLLGLAASLTWLHGMWPGGGPRCGCDAALRAN